MQGQKPIEECKRLLRTHWTEDAETALSLLDDTLQGVDDDPPGDPFSIECRYWRVAALTCLERWTEAEDEASRLLTITDNTDLACYALGRYFLAAGGYDDTIACFTKVLDQSPDHQAALKGLIRAKRLAGKGDAIEIAEQAVISYPDNLALWSEWVWALLGLHDETCVSDARGVATAAFERFGVGLEQHLMLARVLAAEGRYNEALQRCENALSLNGDYYAGLLLRSWLLDRIAQAGASQARKGASEVEVPEFSGSYSRDLIPDVSILGEAEARADQQDYDGALALYGSVVRRDAGNLHAQHGRLRCLRLAGRVTDAEKIGQDLVERFPQDWPLLVEMGRMYHEQGKFRDALDWFGKAKRISPREAEICVARSLSLCSLRRFGEAMRNIDDLLRELPNDFRLLEEKAWVSYHDARYLDAQQSFSRLPNKDEYKEDERVRAKVNYGLGHVAFADGRYADAQNHFLQAWTEHRILPYQVAYAWSLARSGDENSLDLASDICDELTVASDDPMRAIAHVCLGVIYFKQGRRDESKAHLEYALEISPAHGSRADLGALYAKMEAFDEAKAELQQAIEQDPDDAPAHIELGALLLRDNQIREAKSEFHKAAAVARVSVLATIGLAECYHFEGNEKGAENELRSAIRKAEGSDRWRLHAALARLLMCRGRDQQDDGLLDEAYRAACEAIKLAPGAAEPHYLAGLARRLMADSTGSPGRRIAFQRSAIGHFHACRNRDDDNMEALRELDRLRGDRADRNGSIPGRLLLGSFGSAAILLSFAGVVKLLQMPIDEISLILSAGLILLILAVVYDGLKHIKGPAGMELEFNPRDPLVAVGPVGRLAVGLDHVDLPPSGAFGGQIPRGLLPSRTMATESI